MNGPSNVTDTDILTPQDWTFPVPIAYGPGRLAEIGSRCVAMGLFNPLIVTDHGSHSLPFIAQLQSYLSNAGLEHDLFFNISPNPRDDEIELGERCFARVVMTRSSQSVEAAHWTAASLFALQRITMSISGGLNTSKRRPKSAKTNRFRY